MRAVHVYSDGFGYITIDWNFEEHILVFMILNPHLKYKYQTEMESTTELHFWINI